MSKGVVTNTVQFRGYNTVRMDPGARFHCWPYGVEGMTHISHSFHTYATSALTAAVRAQTRFVGASGATIELVPHTIGTPLGMFEEQKIEAIPVPAGAKQAILEFVSPSGTYWLAMPKTEEGSQATPYSANFSGQMTFFTPTGIYTGTVTAGQVILIGGGNAQNAITTINNQILSLSATTGQNSTAITEIQAGRITLSNLTSGKIGGFTVTPTRLSFTAAADPMNHIQLSVDPADNFFLRAGTWDGEANLFTIDRNGKLIAVGGEFYGLIHANSGRIGGFTLDYNTLYGGTGANYVRLSGNAAYAPIMVGGETPTTAKFVVDSAGHLTAKSATIIGRLEAGSVFAGNLQNASGSVSGLTGSLSGMGGSVTNLGGSIRNMGGTVDSIGGSMYRMEGSVGDISGWSFSGPTFGNHSGGSHSGAVYSESGTLGGVDYTSVGTLLLYINGQIRARGFNSQYESTFNSNIVLFGQIIQGSDRHYKQEIRPLNESAILKGLYDIDIVEYEYKKAPGVKRAGIIANDFVDQVTPELTALTIKPGKDGYLMADYETLSILSILAYKDLNRRLIALEGAA